MSQCIFIGLESALLRPLKLSVALSPPYVKHLGHEREALLDVPVIVRPPAARADTRGHSGMFALDRDKLRVDKAVDHKGQISALSQ